MTHDVNIDALSELLHEMQIGGSESFLLKLASRDSDYDKAHDLLVEAQAALTLAAYGFDVTMREAPDLLIQWGDEVAYVEVKRFRRKQRDAIDDVRLEEAGERGHLVEYGDPAEDGRHPWEQVLDVLDRKSRQYKLDAPLVILIRSDSFHCIEDLDVLTAVHVVDERIAEGHQGQYGALTGVLLFASAHSISERRNVYFYPVSNLGAQLSVEMTSALLSIRERARLP